MKKISVILFGVLFVCINAAAQRDFKLKVLENGTEQPIVAANITYADNEALQNPKFTITNVEGEAVLKLSSKGT